MRKNNLYPCKPQFNYIKVRCKGVFIMLSSQNKDIIIILLLLHGLVCMMFIGSIPERCSFPFENGYNPIKVSYFIKCKRGISLILYIFKRSLICLYFICIMFTSVTQMCFTPCCFLLLIFIVVFDLFFSSHQ